MNITDHTVVSIEFEMRNPDGELLDTTRGRAPITYLHGHDNILPGLEEALKDHAEGDQVQVTVPPEKAYGPRQDDLVQTAPRSVFPEDVPPEVGVRYQAESEAGTTTILVTQVEGDQVTIDANPDLAGITLHIDARVTAVRTATDEELEDGEPREPDPD